MAGPPARGHAAPRTPRPGVLPPVRVQLPDGEVGARLVRRWQAADGAWVYRIALRAWASRSASTGQDLTQDLVELDVPASRVRPVPGTSYEAVPTLRAPHPPAPTAPPTPTSTDVRTADGAPGWLTEEVPRTAGQHGVRIRFHAVSDCWMLTGRRCHVLPVADARHLADTDPESTACDACASSSPPAA